MALPGLRIWGVTGSSPVGHTNYNQEDINAVCALVAFCDECLW